MPARIGRYIPVTLKGALMGAADIVPGVSGGTIALITGIYETLVDSIRSFDAQALQQLLSLDLRSFWKTINGNFLFSLLLGILFSVVTLSNTIVHLLEHQTLLLLSFFFGLIVASAFVVAGRVRAHSLSAWAAGAAGAVAALAVTSLSPVATPESWWFIFLSGAIAICAMILPGISGSFILLLLGKYTFILHAVREFDIGVILLFSAGCALGLMSFSRLLSTLLHRFHDPTMMLLAGIMLGSLTKVWPWKTTGGVPVTNGSKAMLFSTNVLPDGYLETTGADPRIASVLLLMAAGLALVFTLEYLSSHSRDSLKNHS